MKVIEECAQELANQLVGYISETLERTVGEVVLVTDCELSVS